MWWPKFLTYGNWGGPGWSGGVFNHDPALTNWSVPAIDQMDRLFKIHDHMYQNNVSPQYADHWLAKTLPLANVSGVWPRVYKKLAIWVFTVRSKYGTFTYEQRDDESCD